MSVIAQRITGREDDAPAFAHHPVATLPQIETPDGARLRIVAGESFGRRSPVATLWPTLYVASGAVQIDGEAQPLRATELAVLRPGHTARLARAERRAVPESAW
jgi:redox-sensitive bicupin YhaK (pirin superfamily)